ncbi:unnamed protein product (macronuclear) [Paramecium tetraurelia]|uniref:Uncharacterized protein n=1 Tax=Paramecium tetraurelia TaxID=5888 RepID=A0BKY0_PARTE|nr:uncharacterized protein GSPATT00029828001 [Paramecium tetraurelia]CAK59197.1 unnamed protein product [Paramecium tetraurelia]|eukprot:XP_001426595.1 hypothetical protein (macronuclear) [Paramecium tetraurelia strain d4-2]
MKQLSQSERKHKPKQKSEPSLLPNIDILKENVKSSFALGHLRGLLKYNKVKDVPKTEIQVKRDQTFGVANKQSKNKRLTFLKFGFRTHEKKNNYYLQPLIKKVRDVFGDAAIDGSMGVVDLWSDRNVNRLMDAIQMTRDNLIVRKLGKELNEADHFILNRNEEKKIRDRIFMESLKLQFQETDTFSLKFLLSEKDKKIVQRVAQPTISSNLRHTNPNLNIQSIVENIDQLHQENLEIYTNLYKEIKQIQKNIK